MVGVEVGVAVAVAFTNGGVVVLAGAVAVAAVVVVAVVVGVAFVVGVAVAVAVDFGPELLRSFPSTTTAAATP